MGPSGFILIIISVISLSLSPSLSLSLSLSCPKVFHRVAFYSFDHRNHLGGLFGADGQCAHRQGGRQSSCPAPS